MARKERKPTPAHAYAELFPLREGEPLQQLAERIREHGQREPIVTYQKQILDGRRRELACILADKKPIYRKFGSRPSDGDDPLEFVWDANFHRRDLSDTDKAMSAAKYATAKVGRPKIVSNETISEDGKIVSNETITNAQAAAKAGVSEAAVDRAKTVQKHGIKAVQKAVDDEVVSLGDAAAIANKPAAVQKAALAAVKRGEAKTLAEAMREREPGDVDELLDEAGDKVPEHAVEAFKGARAVGVLLKELESVIRQLKEAAVGKPCGAHVRWEEARTHLHNGKLTIKQSLPTHTCPMCKGKKVALLTSLWAKPVNRLIAFRPRGSRKKVVHRAGATCLFAR